MIVRWLQDTLADIAPAILPTSMCNWVQCRDRILKTIVWPSKKALFGGKLHKNVLYKVFTSHSEGPSKNRLSQNTGLQFANRNINIVGLQSWHSSIRFQIPITCGIWTLQLRLGTYRNFSFASRTICEGGFSKQNWVKSDRRSRFKLDTLDALMQVSLCGHYSYTHVMQYNTNSQY